MKLEFFEDAFDGRGLLLLYGDSPREISNLRSILRPLFGLNASVPLHDASFIEPVNNCELTAFSTSEGLGVHGSPGPSSFRWNLSPSEWETVDALLEPFTNASAVEAGVRFQYLQDHEGPEVIFSTRREW